MTSHCERDSMSDYVCVCVVREREMEGERKERLTTLPCLCKPRCFASISISWVTIWGMGLGSACGLFAFQSREPWVERALSGAAVSVFSNPGPIYLQLLKDALNSLVWCSGCPASVLGTLRSPRRVPCRSAGTLPLLGPGSVK